MLPQVLRPANFNTPVVALTLDGLGLTCFRSSAKEWQVAFLRAGHRLTFGVKVTDAQGRIVDSLSPIEISESAEHLRLSVDTSSQDHYSTFREGYFKAEANFAPITARKTKDDSYDFRWVPDILREIPHGTFIKLKKKNERPAAEKVTIVSIPNALFFTNKVTDEPLLLAPHPKTSEDPESFVFGRTNEKVGGALYSATPAMAAVRLHDVTSGTGIALPPFNPLPPRPGLLYEISILNMDVRIPGVNADDKSKPPSDERILAGHYVPGDLHRFYEIINVDGTPHQIFAPPRAHAHAAIDGDCHIEGAGHNGGSLTDLSGLLAS